jgi:CDP-paratose 2-epimerase
MKILITGACGFVGSSLATALAESLKNVQILGIDNLGRPGADRNRTRLKSLGIPVTHGDIRLPSDLAGMPDADWVLDCAANPSVLAGVDGKASARQLIEHNLGGTVNLLEFCRERRAGFILLSTSRVYSIRPLASLPVTVRNRAFTIEPDAALPPAIGPAGITEAFSTQAPVSLYGATKIASEQLALEYAECFDLPVWINRCGVLAGAGQFGRADQGIFAFWLHSWREKRKLKYIGFDGKGHQTRDCLHPRDLASLVIQQILAGADRARPTVTNVSGGATSARSLRQLSDWCEARWGAQTVDSDPVPRAFDLPWVVLDSAQAQTHWNWKPSISADQILEEIASFADSESDWIATCQ